MEYRDRKKIRLENFDYSRSGLYFVTICTKDRFPYLSEIIDERTVWDGVLDVPIVKITEYGIIVNDQINEINNTYENVEIAKYVIMPDHVHMVISIFYENGSNEGTSRTPSPTNAAIPAIVSTFKRFINKKIGFNIWQRSYHDRIIRSEKEMTEIFEYIDNNPVNWANNIFNQNLWR